AARRAAAGREAAAGDLRGRDYGHVTRRQATGERLVDDRVAVRDVPRHRHVEEADQREPDQEEHRSRPWAPTYTRGDRVEEADVADRQQAEHHAEHAVGQT